MSKLEDAREYEQKIIKKIPQEQRPIFHLTPSVGWMNDPNGFSVYKGEYHLFYQSNPYDIHWGPMYWGHCKTEDFIKWERLPIAMAPDQDYETGCFSGTALEMKDGKQLIMYTSDLQIFQEDGEKKVIQNQSIAFGDGVNYEKYEKNPVISTEMIPDGIKEADFRDPKIWKEEDAWYAIVCGRLPNESGAILLYRSEDAKNWKYEKIIDRSNWEYGGMWECPDFFEIGNKAFFIVSPMEMMAEGLEFHNGHGVIYLSGEYNHKEYKFTRELVKTLDYGLDFYAPQSLKTKDGRQVMIAWMQAWENYMTPEDFKWSGMMTIPREITQRNGILYQTPVRELENYYRNVVVYGNYRVKAGEKTRLQGVSGRVCDLKISVRGEKYEKFTIYLAENERYHTDVIYNKNENTVTFNRRYSGLKQDIIDKRVMPVDENTGEFQIEIVMDRYSVEMFVGNGAQVMTSLIYTPQDVDGISFMADQQVEIDVSRAEIIL